MDNICLEVVLRMFLKQNFEVLIKEVKHVFIYENPARELHNTCCDYFFLMNVYFQRRFRKCYCSIFLHICFCKRSCDVKDKNYCILCSKVPTQSADDKVLFKEILIDWRDFSPKF